MNCEYLQFLGGRPLRRRRERVLISPTDLCEGPQALQASTVHRWHGRMGIAGRSPGAEGASDQG
jgi:hypothetical protein